MTNNTLIRRSFPTVSRANSENNLLRKFTQKFKFIPGLNSSARVWPLCSPTWSGTRNMYQATVAHTSSFAFTGALRSLKTPSQGASDRATPLQPKTRKAPVPFESGTMFSTQGSQLRRKLAAFLKSRGSAKKETTTYTATYIHHRGESLYLAPLYEVRTPQLP